MYDDESETLQMADDISFSALAAATNLLIGRTLGQTAIVTDGQVRAETVIVEQPTRSVKLAARELQACIEKIAGAELPIFTHACRLYSGREGEDGRTEPIPVRDGAEAD